MIQWPSTELDHITFVTRAVRVIDLITNLDMQSFQVHSGLTSFISRLELEVEHCRKQQPFQIQVHQDAIMDLYGKLTKLTDELSKKAKNLMADDRLTREVVREPSPVAAR